MFELYTFRTMVINPKTGHVYRDQFSLRVVGGIDAAILAAVEYATKDDCELLEVEAI